VGLSSATKQDLTPAPASTLPISLSGQWRPAETAGEVAPSFSTKGKLEAERRFAIIEPLLFPERFSAIWSECGGRRRAVIERIAAKASGEGAKICAKTVFNWEQAYKTGGMQGLARRVRHDAGIRKNLTKADEEQILALSIPKPGVFGALTGEETYRAFREERAWREARIGKVLTGVDAQKYARYLDAEGRLVEWARLSDFSARTLRRYIAEIPEAVRTMSRDGEEKYRNTQEIISHRAISAVDPLEYVVADHRILDVFCRIPVRGGWRVARPWLTAFIDMRTRKWLSWGLFETPSSDSIACVLKKLLMEHGIPQQCYWDNGADFRAEWLEGKHLHTDKTAAVGELDATWRGVLGTLGIRVRHAIVRNARAKLIESNFNRIAGIDKQLPEYCGHRPSARPERLEAMVSQHEAWLRSERPTSPFRTIQEMATFYDAAISDLNERQLQGEGMRKQTPSGYSWMSPNECWEKLIPRIERRTVRTEDLHIVFSKRRQLTIKCGEIAVTFGGEKFYYRLEGEPTQLMSLNGQLVEIAYDPQKLSQVAVYWRERFIGLAHSVALRKMSEDLFVEDEKQRRAARREVRRAIAAVHKIIPVAGPEERLARRREVAPVRVPCERPEVALQLPAPLAEASAASAAEKAFSFAAVEATIPSVEPTPDDDEDTEFHFFSH
jgi:hypothetical protein